MTRPCTARTLALTAAALMAGPAVADVFLSSLGLSTLDATPTGEFVHVGITAAYEPVPGVVVNNTTPIHLYSLYTWSDSVVTLTEATFSGEDLQAHDSSTINYAGGYNPYLSLITFDDAVINVTGGTIGYLGTGGGMGAGGTAYMSGGTVTETIACAGGAVYVSGGTFGTPTYGLPYTFISLVPDGVTFQGTNVLAHYVGVDTFSGFDGNVWQLTGTLDNGGTVDGLYMVDVGNFDPTVIVNYAGVTIAGSDHPPVADAGADFSVNEGDMVVLDGTQSHDPDGDTLSFQWTQISGPAVTLTGEETSTPFFIAPAVALGGETISFQLTVTANAQTATDTVSVNVVNINHTPVAITGPDLTVAEGGLVILNGEDSFDVDGDAIVYTWTQVSGSPAVTLNNPHAANPSFPAPMVGSGGTTLVFELRVDDGFPADAPPDGYTFEDAVAQVTVTITNQNGTPCANAGPDQCVKECKTVKLDGSKSKDPDNDPLTFSWTQVSGPAVTLSGANTAKPTFTAPQVNGSGATLKFKLTVNDGYGGVHSDTVQVQVQNVGNPPNINCARPSKASLWPPNHQMECIEIEGISSNAGECSIEIIDVIQCEPTWGLGDGDTKIDAVIHSKGKCYLRAERGGWSQGRTYWVHFKATNNAGSATGCVKVTVPKQKHKSFNHGNPCHNSRF